MKTFQAQEDKINALRAKIQELKARCKAECSRIDRNYEHDGDGIGSSGEELYQDKLKYYGAKIDDLEAQIYELERS